jgi:hypothetical protein
MQNRSAIAAAAIAALVLTAFEAGAQGRGSPTDDRRVDGRQSGTVHRSRDDDRRGDTRQPAGVFSSRDGYSANDRYAVPRGHMPRRGMCRIWLEGVPAARQPRATDCATALRNRPVNSRILFGADGIRRSSDPRFGSSQYTIYRVMLNGRRCEVRERFDRHGRAHYDRRCEQRNRSRDDWWIHDTGRRDDRMRFDGWVRI